MFITTLIAFSLIIPLILKFVFPQRICWFEYLGHSLANLMISLFVYFLVMNASTMDWEIISGEVTSKSRETVSCSHSYSCNCREVVKKDSNGKRYKTEECDTCYRHKHDYDWMVYSNVGSSEISRIDSQGIKEPPRFSEVQVGDPYSDTRMFTNYFLATKDTLYRNEGSLLELYKPILPKYPSIEDYYKVNRVFTNGVSLDTVTLNRLLNIKMKEWGTQKQANVLVAFVGEKFNQDYYHALKAYWIGGKKNDVVVVTQLDNTGKVTWSRVFARSESQVFDKSIEYDVGNMGQFDAQKFTDIIDKNIKERFKREKWDNYKYLLASYSPSWVAVIVGMLFSLGVNLGLGYAVYRGEFFDR